MLPLFGNLSRAMSTSAVTGNPHHVRSQTTANTPTHYFHSFSNPNSVTDLTISPPRSPNGGPLLTQSPIRPLYMPDANRRQRRASLVSVAVVDPSLSLSLSLSSSLSNLCFFLCFSAVGHWFWKATDIHQARKARRGERSTFVTIIYPIVYTAALQTCNLGFCPIPLCITPFHTNTMPHSGKIRSYKPICICM